MKRGTASRKRTVVSVIVAGLLLGWAFTPHHSSNGPAPVDPQCRAAAADAYATGKVQTTDAAVAIATLCDLSKADQEQRDADARRAIDGP